MTCDDDIKRINKQLDTIYTEIAKTSREVGETKIMLKTIVDGMESLKKSVDDKDLSYRSLINQLDVRVVAAEKKIAQFRTGAIVVGSVITIVCALFLVGIAFFTYFK